jgi:hypothetical protein
MSLMAVCPSGPRYRRFDFSSQSLYSMATDRERSRGYSATAERHSLDSVDSNCNGEE